MEHEHPDHVSASHRPPLTYRRNSANVPELESPEPAHHRQEDEHDDDDDDEREALELRGYGTASANRSGLERTPTASGDAPNSDRHPRRKEQAPHWHDAMANFWRRQINISVPHDSCRDHLANERTYLAYLRTSLALSMIGAVVSQLFTLQRAPVAHTSFDYYVLGTPLAATFQVSALCMAVLGGFRFWRQQNAMARGKVLAGGWEIFLACIFVLLLMLALFVLHVCVDADEGS